MLESLEENARDCVTAGFRYGVDTMPIPSLTGRYLLAYRPRTTPPAYEPLFEPPVELSQISEPYNYQCVIEHYRTS
ncbi:hypothetical protein DTO169E5_2282 [Paecilomyces variotii]|nr:hypothetical protein DTO169E5_2282 [Paecilomyces variotii]